MKKEKSSQKLVIFKEDLSEEEISFFFPNHSGKLHCLGPLDRPCTASEKRLAFISKDKEKLQPTTRDNE